MFDLIRPRRRRTLRRALPSVCEAVRLDGFSRFSRRILDLSPHGALLACDAPIDPGDEVVLSFRAPKQGPWIDVVSEVCRVFGDDVGYCAGVSFTELEPALAEELGWRLRGVPPPIPRRRPVVDYAATVRQISHTL